MAKINKKGILLSTLALMFLVVLVSLAQIGNNYDSFVKQEITKSIQLHQEEFLRKDITYTVLDILQIKIIKRNINNITLTLPALANNSNIQDDLITYTRFMEGNFSLRANKNIYFENTSPKIELFPLTNITLSNNAHSIQIKNITHFNLTLTIFEEIISNITPSSDSSENPLFTITIQNETDKLYSESRNMNISEERVFEVMLASGILRINSSDHTIYIESNSTTRIDKLELAFDEQIQRIFIPITLTIGTKKTLLETR